MENRTLGSRIVANQIRGTERQTKRSHFRHNAIAETRFRPEQNRADHIRRENNLRPRQAGAVLLRSIRLPECRAERDWAPVFVAAQVALQLSRSRIKAPQTPIYRPKLSLPLQSTPSLSMRVSMLSLVLKRPWIGFCVRQNIHFTYWKESRVG